MEMKDLFEGGLGQKIKDAGIVAVLVIDDAEDAVPLANALLEGGINAMELTLRTPAALPALANVKKDVPQMLAGVGTVLTPDQVVQVKDAGAAFAVAPGMNGRVVGKALEVGLPFAPGVATPSDIENALEYGCRALKFFPAEVSGGLKYLKSAAAPYMHLGLEFIPLGGLNEGNLASYFESPAVAAIGGSWIATRDLIKEKNWAKITENAANAMAIFHKVKGA